MIHRYVLLLFQQSAAFNTQTEVNVTTSAENFNISQFALDVGLGNPLGGTFMLVTATNSTTWARKGSLGYMASSESIVGQSNALTIVMLRGFNKICVNRWLMSRGFMNILSMSVIKYSKWKVLTIEDNLKCYYSSILLLILPDTKDSPSEVSLYVFYGFRSSAMTLRSR